MTKPRGVSARKAKLLEARIEALSVDNDNLRARAVRAEAKAASEGKQRNALLDTFITEANGSFKYSSYGPQGLGSSMWQAHANLEAGRGIAGRPYVPTAEEIEETPYPPARPVVTDIMPGDMVTPSRLHCPCDLCSADVRDRPGEVRFIGGHVHAPRGFVAEVITVDPATRQFALKGHARTLACSWDQWRRVS